MTGKYDYNFARPSTRDLSEDIRSLLEDEGEITIAKLARALGESRYTVWQNVRRMEAKTVVSITSNSHGETFVTLLED